MKFVYVLSIVLSFRGFVKCDNGIKCFEKESKKINQVLLEKSNCYRKLHKVDPLTLDDNLVKASTAWSREQARTDNMYHSVPDGKYGENLYWEKNPSAYNVTSAASILAWYVEIDDYQGGFGESTGHFTQLVWKDSKKVGCGVCTRKIDGFYSTYVTCRYTPPGNVIGQFKENVLPCTGKPSKCASSQDPSNQEGDWQDDAKTTQEDGTTTEENPTTTEEDSKNSGSETFRTVVKVLIVTTAVVSVVPIAVLIFVILVVVV